MDKNYDSASFFGHTAAGEAVQKLHLGHRYLECDLLTYGATVAALRVPDRLGRPVDVVLGFDTLSDYEAQDKFIGATVGRYANRIGGASFPLDGQVFHLPANDGANHLHGGSTGFYRKIWAVEALSETQAVLTCQSPDGEAGYPGSLTVRVTFTLSENALTIDYEAVSDKDTVCSLTNHSYFNLAGHDGGSILSQEIRLFADHYTPTDDASIPTGAIAPVDETPMDLREMTAIGTHIDDDFDQLRLAGGYDHNWCIRGAENMLRPAAAAFCRETGIGMTVETTLPGIQFYTGNVLAGAPAGKGGAIYENRNAFCLETQFYPDAPNKRNFPSPLLRAGERYAHTTRYTFRTEE